MQTLWKLTIAAGSLVGIAAPGIVQLGAVKSAQVAVGVPAAQHHPVPQVIIPAMDPVRGEHLFVSKGCVMCHVVNGVGGHEAPKLDARATKLAINPFEFFAKMWRGAAPMIVSQRHDLGRQVEFTGQDLADIAAFLNDRQLQKHFDAANNEPARE